MATLGGLPALVRSKFTSAKEAGDLTFYTTQVSIWQDSAFSFQIRYSPALAKKPKVTKAAGSKPRDVFENPTKLLITDVLPLHNLVLNKFAINAEHFILSTKAYKEQTDLLEEEDLSTTYQCIKSYRENGESLFAFFNSGEHSGASQPHRHIQFLPVRSMHEGIQSKNTWSLLADQLLGDPKPELPFTYFSAPLSTSSSDCEIYEIYISLYNQALQVVPKVLSSSKEPLGSHPEESAFSYNLAMTDHVMVLCPRATEGIKIKNANGDEIGPVALNGTLLGGTLLVKSELEWDALKDDPAKLRDILNAIGITRK